jgi:hypothetical protein
MSHKTVAILGAIATLCALLSAAFAKDNGQFGSAPADVREWFKSLKSPLGVPCCDTSDGTRLEDVDWRQDDGGYSVRIDGEWVRVPKEAVVDQLNRVGFAIIWRWGGKLQCFLPGTLT